MGSGCTHHCACLSINPKPNWPPPHLQKIFRLLSADLLGLGDIPPWQCFHCTLVPQLRRRGPVVRILPGAAVSLRGSPWVPCCQYPPASLPVFHRWAVAEVWHLSVPIPACQSGCQHPAVTFEKKGFLLFMNLFFDSPAG